MEPMFSIVWLTDIVSKRAAADRPEGAGRAGAGAAVIRALFEMPATIL